MSLKLTSTSLNPFEKAYENIKNTPFFNDRDWEVMLNRSEQDLTSYIGMVNEFNKIKKLSDYETTYGWSDMDTDQRSLLMYNELYGDKEKKNNYDVTINYDSEGNPITEKQELTEYEYNDKLLKQWASYNEEQKILYMRNEVKNNADFWQTMWLGVKSAGATLAEFGLGIVDTVENIVNIGDAIILGTAELFDTNESIVNNWHDIGETFRERMSDDTFAGIDVVREALLEWEEDNTYYMTVDGRRTTAGKLLGDTFFSIGNQVVPAVLTWGLSSAGLSMKAAGTISQSLFYTSSAAAGLQETFRDDKYNSVSTGLIVGEQALKTGVEFLIEKGLGDLFGPTKADLWKGTVSGNVGKLLQKGTNVLANYVWDGAQEALEETLQDFSGWFIDNAVGLIVDEYRSDLNPQQLLDAAMLGFASSLIMGGFYDVRNAIQDERISKKFVEKDLQYSKIGELTKKSDKESKEQKQYRKSSLEFARAKQQLDTVSTGYSLEQVLGKRKFVKDTGLLGLKGVAKAYKNATEGITLNSKQGFNFLKQITKQLYSAKSLLSDVYSKIGIQRANDAEKLLDELTTYDRTKSFDEYLRHAVSIEAEYEKELSNFSDMTAFLELNLEDANKKADEKLKNTVIKKKSDKRTEQDKVSKEAKKEIKAIFDKSSNKLVNADGTKEELKTAEELSKLYGEELIIWDNHEIVEVDDKIFAPIEAAKNMSAKELMKAGAERTIVDEFVNVLDNSIKQYLTDEYKSYSKTEDTVQAIWNTLYNSQFYNYLVNRADERLFNILKVLDNLAITNIRGDKNVKMYQEYNLAVRRIRQTMGPALAMYFCNNPYASLENVTIFNERQLKFINEHRYNSHIANVVEARKTTDANYESYIKVLTNRINFSSTSKADKEMLISSLKSNPSIAIKFLDEAYPELNFYGKYNNKDFKKGNDVKTARINSFLSFVNMRYIDLLNGEVSSNTIFYKEYSDWYASQIRKNFVKPIKTEIQAWLNEQFINFTNKDYKLSFTENNVTVEEVRLYKSSVNRDIVNQTYVEDGTIVNLIPKNLNVYEYIKDILTVDETSFLQISLNDIINNPKKYLSLKAQNDIYTLGPTNNTAVMKYLQKILFNKSAGKLGISLTSNGRYIPVALTTFEKVLNAETAKLYKENKSTLEKRYKGTYDIPITKFISAEQLNGDLKNIKVTFKSMKAVGKKQRFGFYYPDTNTIYINDNLNRTDSQILITILHEFQHAVQEYNNLAEGSTANFVVTKEMVDDVLKHVPELKELATDDKTAEKIVRRYLYTTAFGEQLSRGVVGKVTDIDPTLATFGDNNTIVFETAWGTTHKTDVSNKIKESVDEQLETKQLTLEERKVIRDDALEFKENVEKALDIIRENKKKGKKTYKKDLAEFKFPKETLDYLVGGKYEKGNDPNWKEANAAIARYDRHLTKVERKQQKAEGMASDRRRQIFKKDAEGTPLMNWYDKYKGYIPQLYPSVQEFVLSATDYDKLDPKLVKLIKNAELTKPAVMNYIRDAKNINDYTFNELKKAFFKNSPFKTFKQVQYFVKSGIILDAAAVVAALKHAGLNKEVTANLLKKMSMMEFIETVKSLTEHEALKNVYVSTMERMTHVKIKDDKGNIVEEDLQYSDAYADMILGMLLYFKGSLSDLNYVANNAKNALIGTLKSNTVFTYSKKSLTKGQNDLRLDLSTSNKDGSDSEDTIGDFIASKLRSEEMKFNDLSEMRSEINEYVLHYYLKLKDEGKINIAELQTLTKNYYRYVSKMSNDKIEKIYAAVLASYDLGSFDFKGVLGKSWEDLLNNMLDENVKDINVGNFYNSKQNVRKNTKSLFEILAPKYRENLPEEYNKYFDVKTGKINNDAIKNLSVEELNKLNDDIKELKRRAQEGEFLSKAAKKAAQRTRNQLDKAKKTNERLMKKKGYTTNDKGKIVKIIDVKITEDVTLQTTMQMPDKLKQIMETSFTNTRISEAQLKYFENPRYVIANAREFIAKNAELLNSLDDDDVKDFVDFFTKAAVVPNYAVPYDSIKLMLIGYIQQQHKFNGRFNINKDLEVKLLGIEQGLSHNFGQVGATIRTVINDLKPEEVIIMEMLKFYDIDLEGEPEVGKLAKIIRRMNDKSVVKATKIDSMSNLQQWKMMMDELNQVMNDLERKAMVKYKRRRRMIREDVQIVGRKIKGKKLIELRDKVDNIIDLYRIKENTVDTKERELLKVRKQKANDLMKEIRTELGEEAFQHMIKKNDILIDASGQISKIKGSLYKLRETLDSYAYSKKHAINVVHSKILSFQKAMMLSSPATIGRNWLTNVTLGGFNYKGLDGKTHRVGGMNDLADIIGKFFAGKVKVEDTKIKQYDLARIKVTDETMKFITEWVVDSGLMNLVSDGLTKYDPKEHHEGFNLEDKLIQMITKGTLQRITRSNVYDHDKINFVVNTIFKAHSDDKFIRDKTLRLFGKMLEFDKVDLSKGMTDQTMSMLAEAYIEAAYEFMHKDNFVRDWISSLREKSPNAHFVLNLVEPMLTSGWNWFIDVLQMNPIALAVNMRKLADLERYVDKLDEARRKGSMQTPDSRFAKMLVQRNIGKGVIGTVLMILGLALGKFKVIVVDEEDEKLKLKIGDTYIDFSGLYASTSLFVGVQLANPKEGDVWTILESAFNQQFEDSILTSFMNSFRYNDTPWDYLSSLPFTIASTFVPNIWKQTVRATNNHTVKYSKGLLGDLEYLAISIVPFLENVMPKGIDPYTGEWEERYSVPYIHQITNMLLPLSFKTYNKSAIELAFDEVGLTKKMLKGEYEDLGKLGVPKLDVNILNEFYGKMNNKVVSDFIKNKTKYEVENENGKRVTLSYSQMSTEQIKSVLNRITTQNANYAKIFTWTTEGHKYYCSSSKRLELVKLGITKNVFVGDKGFVK